MMLWSESFELGLPDMDRQHRELLQQVNALADALLGAADVAHCLVLIDALVGATRAHFDWEEALMAQNDYVSLASHREQHHELLGTMERLARDARERRHILNRPRTLQFLRDWYAIHIRHSDADFVTTLTTRCDSARA